MAALVRVGPLQADPSDCPQAGEEKTEVAAVEPGLELRLADGRLVRLAGVDPAASTPSRPDLPEMTRAALAAMLVEHAATLRLVASTPDRWGRLAAYVFRSETDAKGAPRSMNAAAIAAGLGRYLAEPDAHACRAQFVASEAQAREAKLGLWGDPYYSVLAVDDRSAFAERSGTVVLAEGRLVAVQPGPYRTKLRFSAREKASSGGRTLIATILPRTMKTFEGQRVDFKALVGRTLRLRGLLDLRFGPQIELRGPDDVDVLTPPLSAAD